MSNYEQNNTMVVCILAVLIGGAAIVGVLSFWGGTWELGNEITQLSYDENIGSTTGTINLDVEISVGNVDVNFADNSTLLYDVTFDVTERNLEEYGTPSVMYTSNEISINYEVASVNITLGRNLNYTLSITIGTGEIEVSMNEYANVGDVTLTTTTGGIELTMSDETSLMNSPTFDFNTGTGEISIQIDILTGVGGSFEGSTNTGTIDVTAVGWTEVTSTHYETSDYDTASQNLTIVAQTNVGSITALLG
ncbi:MAG: hypothetical protein GF411_01080 [Candidatus Lokiarchaeota archaeon]|nr:hypothetical protein [Candidatus Lokiarchaeota archaeon]